VHPGAVEICNNIDDNCNGRIDEYVRPYCGVGWCLRESYSCSPDLCFPGDPVPEIILDGKCDDMAYTTPILPLSPYADGNIIAHAAVARTGVVLPRGLLRRAGDDRGTLRAILREGSLGTAEADVLRKAVGKKDAELIREQLMLQTEQELPYTTAVVVDAWEEEHGEGALPGAPRSSVRISATVHVERESQKGIVIGKAGQRIKSIGTAARAGLERLGWQLHRIWGPSWYRDRAGQEERLRAAIQAASTGDGQVVARTQKRLEDRTS
jgi:hypothetical protein